MNSTESSASPPPASRFRKVVQFLLTNPLTRIVVGFALIIGCTILVQALITPLRITKGQEITSVALALDVVAALIMAAALLVVYSLFVRFYEQRWPREVVDPRFWIWLPVGFLTGALLISTAALLLRWGGWATIERIEPSSKWASLIIRPLAAHLVIACLEEILVRGIFFRIIEKSLGSWWALAISALFFGLVHLANPNATWFAALGLSLQAGVLLGAAYMMSRSLWFPIGIHWAWNAIQAGVYGGALSGNTIHAILTAKPNGSAWLSGGEFGIEGSVISTTLGALVGYMFCILAIRQQQICRPFWAPRFSSKAA